MPALTFQCEHRYPDGFELKAAFSTAAPVTALVGPSGCGKSSILAIIAGTLRPQSGRVQLGDDVLLDTAKSVCMKPEHRQVGVVFQDVLLFPHLSVRANLEFGLRRRPARKFELERVTETLQIADLLPRAPGTLSGGQRQRVAIGRALLRGPRMLLLDEPWAALHAELKERVTEYVRRIIDEFHIPTLLVTHLRDEVERLADNVIPLGGAVAQ